MSRYLALYLTTLIVLMVLDYLFLGVVAKGFMVSEVGDMLAEVKPVPAVLFYLIYVVGVLIFVSGGAAAIGRPRCSMARCSDCSATRPSISPASRCSSTGAGRSRPSTYPGARW